MVRKASYASGLFNTIVIPAGVSFLPIVILIVPTSVPIAISSAVIPAKSLVTLLIKQSYSLTQWTVTIIMLGI